MFAYRIAAVAALAIAAPALAVTDVHIDSAGIYAPGHVGVIGGPQPTELSAEIRFTANKPGGPTFDLLGFCVDLYHNIYVNIGSQLATSLDYHRGQLLTDSNGNALTSTQAREIGGLAALGFNISAGDPDRDAKLAAVQQAIWTIEYPALTFDGSIGLPGQQGYAEAYLAAAPTLKGQARAFYANDGSTQGFVVAGVPEPASWALMLAGFAIVGLGARRRQRVVAA